MKSFILVCLLFTLVCAQSLVPISSNAFGKAGNGTIYYQSTDFFKLGNVQNPIEVSISYQTGVFNFDASICMNYNGLTVNGAALESSCPAGGYGTASNSTSYLVAPANNQIAKTQYSSLKSKFIGSKMAMASSPLPEGTTTETTAAKIYIKPSSAGFVVTVPDSVDLVYFYVGFSGVQCADPTLYPVANGSCTTIPTANVGSNSVSVPKEGWAYYQFSVNAFTDNINSFNVTINGTKDDIKLYTQSGYYPTEDWFINTVNDDDSGILTAVIANPSNIYISANETFFFGIYNGDDKNDQIVNFTITTDTSCTLPVFGYLCSHSLSNSSDPVRGYEVLNATLVSGTNGTVNTYSYDFTNKDDYSDFDYAYFLLSSFPLPGSPGYVNLTYPYYVRVTVANNDVSEYAPGFFAKKGGFPSAQSAYYNVSTTTDITHQIIIPVTSAADVTASQGTTISADSWVFGVQLKSDFSIWVGINCANDCDADKHGVCYCGTVPCANLTAGNTEFSAYYTLPVTTVDSGGACTCDDDDYDYSYDCSQKNNGNAALYIVLIAVGGMIVLAVAIGVPIYCYISNKKATRYDRM